MIGFISLAGIIVRNSILLVDFIRHTQRGRPLVGMLPTWRTQRTVADFRQKNIKADRELRRDSSYVAEFVNVPIRTSAIDVELDEEERALFERLKRSEIYEDDGAAMRDILFSWWEEERPAL